MKKFNIMFARCFPWSIGFIFILISGVMFMQGRASYIDYMTAGAILFAIGCICTFLEEILKKLEAKSTE